MVENTEEQRRVYDNIHGYIYLPKVIWHFIDTPHFQRLRKIKQLSTQEFVTPGATHTRFEHSIGTAYLAKKFIETLIKKNPKYYPNIQKEEKEKNERAVLIVTLAGLLHDIGHGPFSHAFEDQVVTFTEVWKGQNKKWSHQIASEEILRHMTSDHNLTKIYGKFSGPEIQRVKALISGVSDGVRPWQFHLISNKRNGIDVDKLDYFRRDAFYLGAKNIYIDHDLLMNEARIIGDQICYPSQCVEAVNNVFHSRYKLYKLYYFNVVVKATELMICDILKETREYFRLEQACRMLGNEQNGADEYIRLNDSIIQKIEDTYERIKNGKEIIQDRESYLTNFKKAKQLLQKLRERKLYSFVKELTFFVAKQGKDELKIKEELQKIKQAFKRQKIMDYLSKLPQGLTKDEICVTLTDVGYGGKTSNPLNQVGFFRQEIGGPRILTPQEIQKLTLLYTENFVEKSIKFFVKNDKLFNRALSAIQKFKQGYSKEYKFDDGQGGRTTLQGRFQGSGNQTSELPDIK